jgi:GntR family histidine utilization transcriptional repressor
MAKPTSLQHQIRADIEKKILSGAWAPGFRIPVEHELMARYSCARMTVSQALSSLVQAGLLVRRKRGGSFVAEQHFQSVVLAIPDIRADILARGAAYGLKLLSREIRKPKGAAEKWLGQDGKIIALKCLHLANGRPFALEHRLISLKNVPEAAQVDFSEEPPGSWLLGHVAWSQAENKITAISADQAIARPLNLDIGTACLNLERRTWRGAARITQVCQLFPGHLFELVARFNPAVHTRGPGR